MKKTYLISIAMMALLFTTSCNAPIAEKPQVKNVIYLIGDGMGFGAVSSLLLSEDSLPVSSHRDEWSMVVVGIGQSTHG